MRWGTIALVLGEKFGEVYSQTLVQNVFKQMKKRSSQVLTSMEKATKNQDYVKEILEECEKARLQIQNDSKMGRTTIEGMKSRR